MLDLNDFIRKRPFLYHLTDKRNLARIAETMRLDCASSLFRDAGKPALVTQRRAEHMVIVIGGAEVHVRDQEPLHEGHVEFEPDWDFARLVESLNKRVYFWPGTAGSPNKYGVHHFARYLNEGPAILKVPSRVMFDINRNPLFCEFNSGAPRCSNKKKSPRGAATFRTQTDFSSDVSDVVEVTFEGAVQLPEDTQLLEIGEWAPFAPTHGA